MKLRIRAFSPADLTAIDRQDAHDAYALCTPEQAWSLCASPNEAWTLTGDGTPLACAGVLHFTTTRARVWTLFGRNMTPRAWGKASLAIGSRLEQLLDRSKGGALLRLEAETLLNFVGGHALLAHHGFKFEGIMPGCGPAGEAFALYGRLADGVARLNPRLEALRILSFRTMVDDILPAPPAAQRKAA